jgi:hypothetical protein
MNINMDNLFIGMKFKPTWEDPNVYGVCSELTKDEFTFIWIDSSEDAVTSEFHHIIKVKTALECFNLYGWRILSGLESELL